MTEVSTYFLDRIFWKQKIAREIILSQDIVRISQPSSVIP